VLPTRQHEFAHLRREISQARCVFNMLNTCSGPPFCTPAAHALQSVVHYREHLFYALNCLLPDSGASVRCPAKGRGIRELHPQGRNILMQIENSPATAVERALNILEAAAQRRDGLTNSEISRKLGIPKSSASYILRTLDRRGYLRRDSATGRYRLGLKILTLGGDLRANLDFAELALPFMQALQQRLHLTVHLAALDQNEAVYIEKVEAPGFFRVNTWVGRRMYLHSTSVGKCLLAWRTKQEVETILRDQGLKKRTPKTITSMPKLLAELAHVREQGYSVDDEENSLGARCVAAPILDAAGSVAAAVGISGTVTQLDEASLPRILEALKDAARKVSREMQRSGTLAAAK
jgi:IclR family transcriptional regulator, acetate operon repressor